MSNKIPSRITADDLPEINAGLTRQQDVLIKSGPNGTAKIIHLQQKTVKTVQQKDCKKTKT